MDAVEITELEKIEADRVDGVGTPANGIGFLMLKQVAPEVAKGQRDCPKCDKSYDADHEGDNCENCGTKLPAPASKAADDGDAKKDCPTCKGDGKIMAGKRDCPDCDASGKVTPAKAKSLASKSLAKMIIAAPNVDPVLLLKAVGADGEVDEQSDIDGGTKVLAMIADLIIGEAQELKAGQAGEIADLFELCCAAEKIWCWRTGEQAVDAGTVMPAAGLLMQSAAKADMSTSSINDLPDSAFAFIESGGKKDDEGKTTPRSKRHFPVHDKAHADNAAARIAQGAEFGDKAKAKVEAAQRKFGEDTSKATFAEGGTTVDTGTQETGDLSEIVKAAVTEATADLKAQLATAQADLAKVLKLPVPGGPMLSAVRPGKNPDDERAAKALRYETQAETMADPREADLYRQLAAQERAKITSP